MQKMNHILVHYHEIALKGKNRKFFEEKLAQNIRNALKDKKAKVARLDGRILVELSKEEYLKKYLNALKYVFGISSFSPVLKVETDLKEIKKAGLNTLPKQIKGKTFKVETKRGWKGFKLNSMEVSSEVGAHILKNTKGLKVDVKKPKLKIKIEILKDKSFVYSKKIKGLGGLPVGVSGNALVLLSGGIDSPVAAYFMLKRGCNPYFLHFHSYPFTDKASIEKAEELVQVLSKYQGKKIPLLSSPFEYKEGGTKSLIPPPAVSSVALYSERRRVLGGRLGGGLFLASIIDFQKEVVKISNQKYRIILYRRLMYKVAEHLAQKIGAKAIVSGDNLGQVASQTIENMSVIGNGIDMPILRPLVGFDKEDIIDLAKKIKTFKLSIEPHGDCCSVFLPKNPATKARLEDIIIEEKKIGMERWVKKIVLSIT